jgi:probable rRNA maturation factor
MKLNLEINNLEKKPLKKTFVEKVITETLNEAGLKFLKKRNISVSLAIVGKSEMKKINKKYRSKNQVTDILSFSEFKNSKEMENHAGELFLGELILCYDDIKAYSQKNKIQLKTELVNVISHGVLHLLNFRHGRKMFEIQNKVSEKY